MREGKRLNTKFLPMGLASIVALIELVRFPKRITFGCFANSVRQEESEKLSKNIQNGKIHSGLMLPEVVR